MLKILQLNLNGYLNNYNHLQTLIKNKNPKIISIQDTHLHSTNNIPIPISLPNKSPGGTQICKN